MISSSEATIHAVNAATVDFKETLKDAENPIERVAPEPDPGWRMELASLAGSIALADSMWAGWCLIYKRSWLDEYDVQAPYGDLCDYSTGEFLRGAEKWEANKSEESGPEGVFSLSDGQTVYVI